MGIVNSNQIHKTGTQKAINALIQYHFQTIHRKNNPECPFMLLQLKNLFKGKAKGSLLTTTL
jgi:hypothetical protein